MLFVGEVFISEPPAAFHVRTTAALLGVNVLTHAIHHMYPYTKARKRRIPSSEMLVQMLLVASSSIIQIEGSQAPTSQLLGVSAPLPAKAGVVRFGFRLEFWAQRLKCLCLKSHV